jgi:geranylgeranylglycerol-phosphate geranylgeranyltransferase
MSTHLRPRRTFYEWFLRFCARFGDAELGVGASVMALAFFVALRNYLELTLFGEAIAPLQLAHYVLFYFGLALSLALLLHALTARPLLYVVRLVFPGLILSVLPPVLDGTVFAGVTRYDYLPRGGPAELLHAYLTWFGPITAKGVTPGMRIEIAIATLAVFVFVHAHTRSLGRALLGAWLGYSVLFAWVALPVFIELPVQLLGGHWERDAAAATRLIVGVCALLVVTAFARHQARLFAEIVRDLRWLRLLHYELMFVLGLCLALGAEQQTTAVDYAFRIGLGAFAIALAWAFAVINNNLFDIELDRINAPQRPLVSGAVDAVAYARAGWGAFGLALGLGFAIHPAALLLIALFCLGYYVYSSPPLRLKENCSVSKLVIGLNSVACMILGQGLASGLLRGSPALSWAVFAWFSLGAHMIDLKDVQGDRAAGIKTLATMLGRERAQRVIGGGAVVAHLVAAVWLRDSWLALPIAAAGLLQGWAVARSPYRETPVLWLQNLVSLAVIVRVLS